MKHLKTYKIFEAKMVKVLYHGSPYMFKSFKPTTTFFSDTEKFALEYAETKSMDYAIDNSPNIYTVKVKTELFDVNNKKDFKLLEEELPDSIEVFLTNFPMGTKVPKEEVLNCMRGYTISEPDEKVELDSTWRFFENRAVEDIITKHGYGGYVAKEDGVNTYAIFHPEKDVEILNYQFPQGMKFDSIEEYKKYMDLLEYSRTINKNVYTSNVYKWFKKGLSKVEVGIEIKKKMRIEKEYWSLIDGGMNSKEAKEKAEKSVTEAIIYESVEPLAIGDFYRLFNTLVYIDDMDIFGNEWRISLLKGNGQERIYIGSKKDIIEDFEETSDFFKIKRLKEDKKT